VHELAVLVDAALVALDGGASRYPLEPMSSFERKIVHDLAAERGLTSVSEGEGRDRHTVLTRA
jgi:spoIIIJ-associated protein